MHFDKTSPKKRNLQDRKIPATKKQPKLCGKTAQTATLYVPFHYWQSLSRCHVIVTK